MTLDKYEGEVLAQISALYKSYGYKPYKLGSFDEYSLYQGNSEFLQDKNVLTFSESSGKLMALRPDVTLSLIKHSDVPAAGLNKYFYNEKVYRREAGGYSYKEINQTGIEVIGSVDETTETEVALIALKTLQIVAGDKGEYVLDISHMGYVEALFDEFSGERELLFDCLKRKDLHDFLSLAEKYRYSEPQIKAFETAVSAESVSNNTFSRLKSTCLNERMTFAVQKMQKLSEILLSLDMKNISVNFSATGNENYYNGFIFNGYVKGIPNRLLSGGRYDRLLNRMEKSGSAIGFALYLGDLERCFKRDETFTDYLIIYDSESGDKALRMREELLSGGHSARVASDLDDSVAYGRCIDLRGGKHD